MSSAPSERYAGSRGRSRRRRPTRRWNLHAKEEVRIVHGFGAEAPGSGGPWDGDRGEHDYEKHARDDSGASHVAGTVAGNCRSGRMTRPARRTSQRRDRLGPMPARTIPLDRPLDLRLTLGPHLRGTGDPAMRTVARPGHPGDTNRRRAGHDRAVAPRGRLHVEAWGPGADRALARCPSPGRTRRWAGRFRPGRPTAGRPRPADAGPPDRADGGGPRGTDPGDPRAEGDRNGGPPGLSRHHRPLGRAGARSVRAPSAAGTRHPAHGCHTRPSTRSGSSAGERI